MDMQHAKGLFSTRQQSFHMSDDRTHEPPPSPGWVANKAGLNIIFLKFFCISFCQIL
jgi:hypothetical protein